MVGASTASTVDVENVDIVDLVKFLPKQQQAYDALFLHDFVLYGGARGPGKSYWLRWAIIKLALYVFLETDIKFIRYGLFCETYNDLRDRQINKIQLEVPAWIGEVRETLKEGLCFFVRDNLGGARIALRNLDDPTKYQSSEFAGVFIDELTKNTRETFDILRGSKRWPGLKKTFFGAATNPGSKGHGWVKALWIDHIYPPELRDRAKEFNFIPALPKDNPYLDESYWAELNSLPAQLRRAWVDGDWNVFVGQAFPAWSDETHVVKPFDIPHDWLKWRAVDWGFSAPFCCLWFAKNPRTQRIYIYREAYGPGLTDTQQAQMIVDMTPPGEQIAFSFADPALWAKKTTTMITSTAEEYGKAGIPLIQADNDRLNGKRKVDRLLEPAPDGLPGLQVFETVSNFRRTFPALALDKIKVEDVDSDQEDHAYDTLKYGLTNIRTQVMDEKRQTPPLHRLRRV